jgi:hypothetical protein
MVDGVLRFAASWAAPAMAPVTNAKVTLAPPVTLALSSRLVRV